MFILSIRLSAVSSFFRGLPPMLFMNRMLFRFVVFNTTQAASVSVQPRKPSSILHSCRLINWDIISCLLLLICKYPWGLFCTFSRVKLKPNIRHYFLTFFALLICIFWEFISPRVTSILSLSIPSDLFLLLTQMLKRYVHSTSDWIDLDSDRMVWTELKIEQIWTHFLIKRTWSRGVSLVIDK